MPRVPSSAVVGSIVALLLSGAQTAPAQNAFQGLVTYRMTNENGVASTMMQSTKGNKFKYESDKREGAFISDNDAQTFTMVDHSQKQYTKVTAADMQKWNQALAGMANMKGMGQMSQQPSTDDGRKITVVKTGRTETVAGVSCDVYAVAGQDANGKTKKGEACIADGVGFNPANFLTGPVAMMAGGRGGGHMPQGMQGLTDALKGNRGIIKMTEIQDNGSPRVVLEATKIQPGSLDDAVFAAPAGYAEKHMPSPDEMKAAMTGRVMPAPTTKTPAPTTQPPTTP